MLPTNGEKPSRPLCRFCHGTGAGPADTRDDTGRVAAVARIAFTNTVWDWSGRTRPVSLTVLPTLAERLVAEISRLRLDERELGDVLRRIGVDHGAGVLGQVLVGMGRIG